MIGILRYNAGNVGSVARALNRLAIPSRIMEERDDLASVSGLIFPGAGAAGPAMENLRRRGLIDTLRTYPKPFLGLCLGMQLLFDFSDEGGAECLGILRGRVRELPNTVIRPHMGWNRLNTGRYAYFVHGFACEPEDRRIVTMTTQYGGDICAGIRTTTPPASPRCSTSTSPAGGRPATS